jgi:hypothetical protein
MAGPAPNTKLWTALENEHQPSGLHLLVGGQVEVSDADKAPVLREGEAKDPYLLALELDIVDCADPAIDAAVWKAAHFHKEVTADQFRRVEVRWDGAAIADFPVVDDSERSKLMDKQAQVQNRAVGAVSKARKAKESPSTTKEKIKKIVKKVAGKQAPEAAAPKKAALKKAAPKKTAKKAAKKAAPKKAVPKKAASKKAAPKKAAPKKAAKKSARKGSPLKKLVKKLVKKLTPAKKKGKKRR